jgi:hypothetical protein
VLASGHTPQSGKCLGLHTGATAIAEEDPHDADHLTTLLTAEAVSSEGGGGKERLASKCQPLNNSSLLWEMPGEWYSPSSMPNFYLYIKDHLCM